MASSEIKSKTFETELFLSSGDDMKILIVF